MKLLNVTDRIRELFDVTNLSSIFEVFDSEDDALQSFGESRACCFLSARACLPDKCAEVFHGELIVDRWHDDDGMTVALDTARS